jgi:hypothetical protein
LQSLPFVAHWQAPYIVVSDYASPKLRCATKS